MNIKQIGIAIGVGLIRLYQMTLGLWLGGNCRFYPSCSRYAIEAIQLHGLVRGAWYAVRRLGRCHPFYPGGVDLVPPQTCRCTGAHAWRS